MNFTKEVAKASVLNFVASAATIVGMLVGLTVGAEAMPVVEEKSKKFFARYKETEE